MRNQLVLSLIGCVALACDPAVSARGVVRDSAGAGVARATVYLWVDDDPQFQSALTDSAGAFAIVKFGRDDGRVVLSACRVDIGVAQQQWAGPHEIPDSVVLILAPHRIAGQFRNC